MSKRGKLANVDQVLVVVPKVIGVVLSKVNPHIGATIELIGSMLGIFVILFLLVSWVPRNYQLLLSTPWPVYFTAISLGLIGMLMGYFRARLFKWLWPRLLGQPLPPPR